MIHAVLVPDMPAGLLHQSLLRGGHHHVVPGIRRRHAVRQIAQLVHHLPVAGGMQLHAVQHIVPVQLRHARRLPAGLPDLLRRKMEFRRQLLSCHIGGEAAVPQVGAEQLKPLAFRERRQLQIHSQLLHPRPHRQTGKQE